MGLSSNVLWHQTRKEAFFEILKSKKLCVSYSQEEIMPKLRLAFPMICLCDLPLSEFASNNWTYGEYAIGFKRDWAIRNGFNPVCYYHHQSNLMQRMYTLLRDAISESLSGVMNMAIYFLSYYKPIEGQLITSKREYKNYRFYDEREYRMVPYFTQLRGTHQMLSREEYASYKEAHNGKSLLDDVSIEFDSFLKSKDQLIKDVISHTLTCANKYYPNSMIPQLFRNFTKCKNMEKIIDTY